MPYGVKANVKAPHRFLRMGGLCWMLLLNPGWGGEKVMVRGTSRSGRQVDAWVDARDLTNFRPGWVPDVDARVNPPRMPFESRNAAQAWADAMNERFGCQPVREHAAKFGRPAA
jgi:hypothetical protein